MLIFLRVSISLHVFITIQLQIDPEILPSRFSDDGMFFSGTGTTYTSDHSGKFGGLGRLDPVGSSATSNTWTLGPLNDGFVKGNGNPESFEGNSGW